MLSCAPGPPTLSILNRASLRYSVKGVAHSVVRDHQFLAICCFVVFSFSIKMTNTYHAASLSDPYSFSDEEEEICHDTNADAPDTQLV